VEDLDGGTGSPGIGGEVALPGLFLGFPVFHLDHRYIHLEVSGQCGRFVEMKHGSPPKINFGEGFRQTANRALICPVHGPGQGQDEVRTQTAGFAGNIPAVTAHDLTPEI
jgi:hypothetical protein